MVVVPESEEWHNFTKVYLEEGHCGLNVLKKEEELVNKQTTEKTQPTTEWQNVCKVC